MKCLFKEEMNSAHSGKKCIVFIQGRNKKGLLRKEMNTVYSGKKCIVFIQRRNE